MQIFDILSELNSTTFFSYSERLRNTTGQGKPLQLESYKVS